MGEQKMFKIVETGIPGLNELLSGGFPEERVILLIGGPGTGKTIFAAQFLYKGFTDFNEKGIFISLDESKKHLYHEMQTFGWDFKKEKEKTGRSEFYIKNTKRPR